MEQQILILSILAGSLGLFIYGKWRYDFVALLALLAATLTGLVPAKDAFTGFSHPAVVTVAAVFALSAALQKSGFAEQIYKWISKAGDNFIVNLVVINLAVASVSAFMNNIGALAIFLPVVMQLSSKMNKPPSLLLIPVAFSSILGGMVTMIGTPPNIIIAMMRRNAIGEPFTLFDFTPVGLGVMAAGVAFLSFLGWRLLPERKGKTLQEEIFEIEGYISELKVSQHSLCKGKSIVEFENMVEGGDILVVGIVRNKKHITSPSGNDTINDGDILIVESNSDTLHQLIQAAKVEIHGDSKLGKEIMGAEDVTVTEAVVHTNSSILGKNVGQLRLRWRFGVNLLAISRSGVQIPERLSNVRIKAGDVLLLRGQEQSIIDAIDFLGCLPLQYRGLKIGEPKRLYLTLLIFIGAILLSIFGVLQIQIAFVLAVAVMHLAGLLKMKDIYQSLDWSIILLLGAMIPVGEALETTGAAQSIAEGLFKLGGGSSPAIMLVITLVGTMLLSDVVNNATAAVLMVPIAIRLAEAIGASIDPFLMAVAIGASCPFLTPIGHQCNAIILGPGGYHFGDYWKIGLLLEILITLVATPLIFIFWPF